MRAAIFNEPRFGTIQQFYFSDTKVGNLIVDHGQAQADRHAADAQEIAPGQAITRTEVAVAFDA